MPNRRPVVTFTMLTPAAARRRDRRRRMARVAYGAIVAAALVTPSPISAIVVVADALADASAVAVPFL